MYGIFTYIQLIFMVNVSEYTSPMDPMGWNVSQGFNVAIAHLMEFPIGLGVAS